jgi:hypothetical protein
MLQRLVLVGGGDELRGDSPSLGVGAPHDFYASDESQGVEGVDLNLFQFDIYLPGPQNDLPAQ